MKDMEKRIYEMAKEIAKNDCYLFDRCPKQPKHNCISQEPEIMLESSKHYITIATWLVDAGYQKVGKDSIVLSGLELAEYKHYKEYTKSLAMVEKELTEKIIMDFYHELITSFKGRFITYDSFCKIAQKHNVEIPRETFTLAELEATNEDAEIKEN